MNLSQESSTSTVYFFPNNDNESDEFSTTTENIESSNNQNAEPKISHGNSQNQFTPRANVVRNVRFLHHLLLTIYYKKIMKGKTNLEKTLWLFCVISNHPEITLHQ